MSRYKCHLSPELLEKAVEELNEPRDNQERLKAIDKLKDSFDTKKYGTLAQADDSFLLRFLRVKKFDQEKALTVLQNYHLVRKNFPKVFEKVENPLLLRSIMMKGILSVLNGYTEDGAAIFLYRPGLLDKNTNLYDLVAYMVIALEKILEDERVQICGISTVEDLTDFNMSIFFQVSPIELGKLNSIYQDAMPVRFKAIYVINEGKIFDILMTLFKPFMKKKLIKRFRTFGNKYTNLHQHVDVSLLPQCYDGTGPEPHELMEKWIQNLTEDWPQDTAL